MMTAKLFEEGLDILQEARVITIEEGIERLVSAYAPELFLPAAGELGRGLEFRRYRGRREDILLYLPRATCDNPGIDNVVAALDVLRERAQSHYALVERHVRLVCPSDSDCDYTPRMRPVVRLARKTTLKNADCCITLVHEAKEISLLSSSRQRDEQHRECFEAEADCLGLLGAEYWEELGLYWLHMDKDSYVGMRLLDGELAEVKL